MAKGVFTHETRFSFVEKVIGDVGAGTEWPIEVNPDIISEVFYRAKDAWFTAGSLGVTWYDSAPGDSTLLLAAPAAAPSPVSPLVAYNATQYRTRGYCTTSGTGNPPAASAAYLGAEYTLNSEVFRDIADDERAMWLGIDTTDKPQWNDINGGSITTALSYSGDNDEDADTSGMHLFTAVADGSPIACAASAVFSGEVAVVLGTAGNDFLAAGNSYYLGVKFSGTGSAFGGPIFSTCLADINQTSNPAINVGNYVLRLNFGDVSCPLYFEHSVPSPVATAGSDIIHEVVEWWPYQDAGGDVWDTATGNPL